MRGQVTIEYILILVIMLVILATVSMPTVEQVEADVTDTGNAINLAAAQQRIISTANEMKLTGCGSKKTITVYIQRDLFTPARIEWDASKVWGNFTHMSGETSKLKSLGYPDNIKIDRVSGSGGYWDISIAKDCTGAPPSCLPNCCIGVGC
ncbi:MAG: hypothetical protein KAW41_06420 [Candidatus Diapherotrites archaeon]|nr:hypothetical protein [Candidatus Diapherotrites archaeon]